MGKKTPSPLSKSVGGRVPVFELTPPHVASPTGGEQLWASEGKLDQLSGKRDFPPSARDDGCQEAPCNAARTFSGRAGSLLMRAPQAL